MYGLDVHRWHNVGPWWYSLGPTTACFVLGKLPPTQETVLEKNIYYTPPSHNLERKHAACFVLSPPPDTKELVDLEKRY
jgi:hypothetical protein